MLDYNFYKEKLGKKFAIVNGELVEDPEGLLTVTETFTNYSIYLSKIEHKASLIIPDLAYVGKTYKTRSTDCISICCKWHDNQYGTNLQKVYKDTTHEKFKKYFKQGMSLWFEDHGFLKTNTIKIGSFIVYQYAPNLPANSHIAICIEPNKILQHIPWKYSSIDTIENEKVFAIYDYTGQT